MGRIGCAEGCEPLDIGKVGREVLALEMTRECKNDVDLCSAQTYVNVNNFEIDETYTKS